MRMPKAPPKIPELVASMPTERVLHCLEAEAESVHKGKYLH